MGQLVDSSTRITSSCAAFDKKGSSFTVTGRGGLPPSPDDPLSSDVIWSDTRLTATTASQTPKKPAAKPASKSQLVAIVPATGWVFNDKGDVTLISANNDSGYTPANCPGN